MRDVTRIFFICVPLKGTKDDNILRLGHQGEEVATIFRDRGYEVYRVTTTWEKLEAKHV